MDIFYPVVVSGSISNRIQSIHSYGGLQNSIYFRIGLDKIRADIIFAYRRKRAMMRTA